MPKDAAATGRAAPRRVILAELAVAFASVALLTTLSHKERVRSARVTGVALTVMERAVQGHTNAPYGRPRRATRLDRACPGPAWR
jgi:hypothetical protein